MPHLPNLGLYQRQMIHFCNQSLVGGGGEGAGQTAIQCLAKVRWGMAKWLKNVYFFFSAWKFLIPFNSIFCQKLFPLIRILFYFAAKFTFSIWIVVSMNEAKSYYWFNMTNQVLWVWLRLSIITNWVLILKLLPNSAVG